MAKKKKTEVGLGFSTIHATPNFQCPWCSRLTYPIGDEKKTHDPVWCCIVCKKLFKPVLREVPLRTQINYTDKTFNGR